MSQSADAKLEYVPYTPTKEIPPAFLVRLRTRYDLGASIRTLAGEMNISYGSTHRLLTRAGVEFRSRGYNGKADVHG